MTNSPAEFTKSDTGEIVRLAMIMYYSIDRTAMTYTVDSVRYIMVPDK